MSDRPVTPRKADATGRSTGKALLQGRAKRWKMEPPFVQMPLALIQSPGFLYLNAPAYKILMFLLREHAQHGGAENGRLLAPHAQLRALGISGRCIRPAFDMLVAFGMIRRTSETDDRLQRRQGGKENAATFALTWWPTWDGELPTEDFLKITTGDVLAFKGNAHDRG